MAGVLLIALVVTPLGAVDPEVARVACAAPQLVVGEVVSAEVYLQLETAGGKPYQYTTYTRFRLRVTHDLQRNAPRHVVFAVPGELRPDLDVRTVAPDGVQPIVGSEWAIGYRRSYRETAMWDRGTPVILVSFAPSPVERGVQRAWSAFCAAR